MYTYQLTQELPQRWKRWRHEVFSRGCRSALQSSAAVLVHWL